MSERWRVQSRLELKFEKLYVKLFLPLARGSTRGASKRYVGLRHGAALDQLEFIGMEVVRGDWTALAKQVQLEMYRRLFAGRPVGEYLANVVKRVRTGELDAMLVYRKSLRKDVDEYTATTPPHVAAARKSTRPSGRIVRYVMTVAGPEPVDEVQNALDRSTCDQAGAARGRTGACDARPRLRIGHRRPTTARLAGWLRVALRVFTHTLRAHAIPPSVQKADR